MKAELSRGSFMKEVGAGQLKSVRGQGSGEGKQEGAALQRRHSHRGPAISGEVPRPGQGSGRLRRGGCTESPKSRQQALQGGSVWTPFLLLRLLFPFSLSIPVSNSKMQDYFSLHPLSC